MIGKRFAESARLMVGTPFHWHGRIVGVNGGLDCSGLIIKAAEAIGVMFSFRGKYSRSDQSEVIHNALTEHCDKLDSLALLEPGDILYVPVKDGPGHLLIFTGETIIHASDTPMHQKVVEQPFGPPELAMAQSAYRLREQA